jgi:hypothetical protein
MEAKPRLFRVTNKIEKLINKTVSMTGEDLFLTVTMGSAPDTCRCNGCRIKAEDTGHEFMLFDFWTTHELLNDERTGVASFEHVKGEFEEVENCTNDYEPYLENKNEGHFCVSCSDYLLGLISKHVDSFSRGSLFLKEANVGASTFYYTWSKAKAEEIASAPAPTVHTRTIVILRDSDSQIIIRQAYIEELYLQTGENTIKSFNDLEVVEILGFQKINLDKYL